MIIGPSHVGIPLEQGLRPVSEDFELRQAVVLSSFHYNKD